MTLRIVGGNAGNTIPHAHPNASAEMRELLVKSVKELSREINFKSILNDCDSHARAAEQQKVLSAAYWTEALSAQDTITEISHIIYSITAADGVLTRLYSLCQSALSDPESRADYAEEIRLITGSLDSDKHQKNDPKIVNLFAANDGKKNRPEWNAETLQLNKIDISTPDAAEASLSLISSAISVLAYAKTRAGQMLSNKQQTVRKLSAARENKSAALSIIPEGGAYTGENIVIESFKDHGNKNIRFSEARRVLSRNL